MFLRYGGMQQLGKAEDDDADEVIPIELPKSKAMQVSVTSSCTRIFMNV